MNAMGCASSKAERHAQACAGCRAGSGGRLGLPGGSLRSRIRAGGESGQALVLAIVIMLLLVFLGSIFVRSVMANLKRAEFGQGSASELAAAEAGIRFANEHLTSNAKGVDWQPHASYNINALVAQAGTAVVQQDPDWSWIQPFDPATGMGGYVRFPMGDARFLLRVTYNPENAISAPIMPDVKKNGATTPPNGTSWGPTPLSRYVMIEAIGRRGSAAEIDKEYQDFLDPAVTDPATKEIDPTVFTRGASVSGDVRLRRELVAFKAIGINDYLRFATDRDRLGRPFTLGVSQSLIRDGRGQAIDYPFSIGVDAQRFQGGGVAGWAVNTGGGIRSNTDIIFVGDALPGATLPQLTVNLLDPTQAPWNEIVTPGRILRQGLGQDTPDAQHMALNIYSTTNAGPGATPTTIALPSSDPAENAAFDSTLTAGYGYPVRDGAFISAPPDQKQGINPLRSTQRLEAPWLETVDPATGRIRWDDLTKHSPVVSGGPASAGAYGYASGIYIDNATHTANHDDCKGDVDHDLDKLRKTWLRSRGGGNQNGSLPGWSGPTYTPPATEIVFEATDWTDASAPAGSGLIWIKRTDDKGWRDPAGNKLDIQVMCFELRPGTDSLGNLEYSLRPKWWDSSTSTWRTWDWGSGAWVDASGANAGTRYPFDGVIYAEGNVRVRGRLPDDVAAGGVRITLVSRATIYIDGNLVKGKPNGANPARSAIALLARDHVCLNTTQFLQITTDCGTSAMGSGEPFYWRFPPNQPDRTFTVSWDFGISPDDARVSAYYSACKPALFLRHQADGGPVTMQWLTNNTPYTHDMPTPQWPSGTQQPFWPMLNVGPANFADTTLNPFNLANLLTDGGGVAGPGFRNTIRIHSYDPGAAPDGSATTGGEYDLAALAIQPLDIVVQALIYAEHGSWFVIPGTYFRDPERYDWQCQQANRYPENQEPLDVQIHVVGAIAEGQPALLDDVTQWTSHWRGANRTANECVPGAADADPLFQKRAGISYEFDPQLVTDTRTYKDSDGNTHLLPALPCLPMSPDLVYFGERPIQ